MKKPAGISGGLSRFRIDFGYDGTDFQGFAKQPNLRTVQSELLTVLEQIFGKSKDDFGMRVAGRTDAGVHALSQVCHIDLNQDQLERLGRSEFSAQKLNGLLAPDLVVYEVTLAPEGFDARFSAIGRSYRYLIADADSPKSPLTSRYELWHPRSLDVKLMQKAAKGLLGLKDFGAFCKPRDGATTIRELRKLQVTRTDDNIEIYLEADAFCHNMVRALVGALIAVGEGRLEPAELWEIQKAAKRVSKFKVVAPHGLALTGVNYPPKSQLAAQAEKAKNMRDAREISV
jgi:tRNA pseudouridine38-40 synthase